MKHTMIALLALLALAPVSLTASVVHDDYDYPSADPKMEIEEEDGLVEETQYSGSAPLTAHFTSNVENL